MKKTSKKSLIIMFLAIVLVFGLPLFAKADDEETTSEPIVLKQVQATAYVNVRSGGGEDYDIIKIDEKSVNLTPGTIVIVIDEKVEEKSGAVWYNILFERDGAEYTGWSISKFFTAVGTVTATPTPSPEPTEAPTETPTPSPEPTEGPSATPVPSQAPTTNSTKELYDMFWKIVVAILVLSVVIIAIIYVYNRVTYARNKNHEMNKKMKYLKNVELGDDDTKQSSVTTTKRPTVRVVGDEDGNEIQPVIEEQDERAILRNKLDKLKQHDIVTHKFFGKGEVYDNSDVKLMEVRFGMDVRYLNKDQLAAKKLLDFDDNDLPTRRKL